MELNEKQLKSFTQILEKMSQGSNIFMPKSKFENIKTFVDDKNNLFISYVSTTPTIDGFKTNTRYMAVDRLGTIDYLSLAKNENELEELYKTLSEIKI